MLVAADYAQIEVRVGAYVSHDPKMLAIVQGDSNIHEQNVLFLFNVKPEEKHSDPLRYTALKTRAKNFFFGWMYGSKGEEVHDVIEKQMLEDPGLAALGIPTVNEIRNGIRTVGDIYGRYEHEWKPFAIEQARENNCTSYTIYGRPRKLPNLVSQDKQEREAAERECISHIIQGTATADIMRLAMARVKTIPYGKMILVVHDELVSDVEPGWEEWYGQQMKQEMELGQPLEDVPIIVDVGIGETWYATHK